MPKYPQIKNISEVVKEKREFKYIDDYLKELGLQPTVSKEVLWDYLFDQYNARLKCGMRPSTAEIVVLYNFSKEMFGVAKELYSRKGYEEHDETTDDCGGDT
jgi:hypothetical protein